MNYTFAPAVMRGRRPQRVKGGRNNMFVLAAAFLESGHRSLIQPPEPRHRDTVERWQRCDPETTCRKKGKTYGPISDQQCNSTTGKEQLPLILIPSSARSILISR